MDKEWGNFFDDLMEKLPPMTRKKVLETVEIDDDGNVARSITYPTGVKVKVPHRGWYIAGAILTLILWSIPLTLVGIILCLTIIGIPIGAFILFIAAFPFAFFFGKAAGA